MGGFRASEADIKILISEALQTKLKEVDNIIASTNKERVRYLSGNKPFWVGLVETDDEFPGEGYHDWEHCGIPEDQLKIRLEFRYQTFDTNLLLTRTNIGSAISCVMPLIQSGTLGALADAIRESDCLQLIKNGLRMLRSQYDDVTKELDRPGFFTQLEVDYSKGRRRSEYEKAITVNHIDDTYDWLNGQYMPEESGDQGETADIRIPRFIRKFLTTATEDGKRFYVTGQKGKKPKGAPLIKDHIKELYNLFCQEAKTNKEPTFAFSVFEGAWKRFKTALKKQSDKV